ncbi:hypothetical protein HK096_006736, partial [Nowakowskiella sp. JEL0078]
MDAFPDNIFSIVTTGDASLLDAALASAPVSPAASNPDFVPLNASTGKASRKSTFQPRHLLKNGSPRRSAAQDNELIFSEHSRPSPSVPLAFNSENEASEQSLANFHASHKNRRASIRAAALAASHLNPATIGDMMLSDDGDDDHSDVDSVVQDYIDNADESPNLVSMSRFAALSLLDDDLPDSQIEDSEDEFGSSEDLSAIQFLLSKSAFGSATAEFSSDHLDTPTKSMRRKLTRRDRKSDITARRMRTKERGSQSLDTMALVLGHRKVAQNADWKAMAKGAAKVSKRSLVWNPKVLGVLEDANRLLGGFMCDLEAE